MGKNNRSTDVSGFTDIFYKKKDDQNPYILVILPYKFTCVYSAAGINITFPSCELSTW